MPDKKGSSQVPDEKRPFIREKIAKPPRTKGQVLKRILVFILIAVLGGTAAGISFAVAGPLAEKYLVEETTETVIPVTIPTDVEPTTVPAVTETEESSSEEETEPIEDIMQSAIEQYQYNIHDFNTMYNTLRDIVQTADSSIVIVHSVQQGVDWFDNPMETSGMYAGIVIADTDREFLILTPETAVESADAISVTFADNGEAAGTVRQADQVSGMAVISVNKEEMDESSIQRITPVVLGNSYNLKQGDVLIAIGAPAGAVHSSAYGFVSYVQRNVQTTDSIIRLLYADIKGDAEAGTFFLNSAGELVGWATDKFENDHNTGMVPVMVISEYKTILEKMTNGIPVPYIGIYGQEVTQAMRDNGIPIGVYVSECIPDSPAYYAGILSGDVIKHIAGRDVITMMDFESKVAELTVGDKVKVVVQRLGAGEYIELEYEVTVGAR